MELFNDFSKDHPGTIEIFDIDDALVVTKAKIQVHDRQTDERFEMTPQEFNYYEKEHHHDLDFSQFECGDILKAGMLVDWVFEILTKSYRKGIAVGVITARGDQELIWEFLMHHGVKVRRDLIMAINDPKMHFEPGTVPEMKKEALERMFRKGFVNMTFYDDSKENLEIAREFAKGKPGLKLKTCIINPNLKLKKV